MTNDPARRIATVIAIPVALLTGFAAFQFLKPPPPPEPRTQSTAPVSLTTALLAPNEAPLCASVIAKLPAQLRDLDRRPVTVGAEQNAAYGQPALSLTCGGHNPPKFPPTDLVYGLNGMCWHAGKGGNVWTTVDREVIVRLFLPPDLAGDGSAKWATAVSPIIRDSIPPLKQIPTGCKPG